MLRAYRVTGRVQGVGFRWFTRQAATQLGLRGTVRNAPDGSVEVVAEGAEKALQELEVHLARGPGAAVVDGIEEIPTPEHDLPRDFRIVH